MSKPAYFVYDVKIKDPVGIKPYLEKIEETLVAYGGKRIVSGGDVEILEGEGPQGKVIILQFESLEKARCWHDSPEYQAIVGFRLQASESNGYLVEGVVVQE